MHFCSYFHFFQIAVNGYHFWVVFTGEIIPMVKNTINSKKCTRAQALLGTFVHFCSYFPLFSIDRLWIPFLSSFWPWLWLFWFSKAKSKAIGCSCTFRTMGMNSPAKTIHIHEQPIEKSEKSEQKSTWVPKRACVHHQQPFEKEWKIWTKKHKSA